MTLIVDAGALFAQANARDPGHAAVAHGLPAESRRLLAGEPAAADSAQHSVDEPHGQERPGYSALHSDAEQVLEASAQGRSAIKVAALAKHPR